MASIVINGDTSGSVTLQAPTAAGATVLTLPSTSGTVVITSGAQTIEFADGSAAAPSITNSGDTNTGIFFPAADTIAFTEGGVEAMRIDSSGNVGIGTSNPQSKLQINSANTDTDSVLTISGALTIANAVTQAYKWQTEIDSNTSYFSFNRYYSSSAWNLYDTGVASSYFVSGNSNLNSYFAWATANTNTANPTERMRIDSSGNVGIGTTTPTSRLSVLGGSLPTGGSGVSLSISSALGATRLTTDASNTTSFIGSYYDNTSLEISQGSTSAYVSGIVIGARSATNATVSDAIALFTRSTERMRIDGSGNLLFNSGYGSAATAYGCRAWVNFNGTGVVAIRASGNVTSITDNGTGDYTVNFTTAMPDANYATQLNSYGSQNFVNAATTYTTTAVRVGTRNSAGTDTDQAYVFVSIFR